MKEPLPTTTAFSRLWHGLEQTAFKNEARLHHFTAGCAASEKTMGTLQDAEVDCHHNALHHLGQA